MDRERRGPAADSTADQRSDLRPVARSARLDTPRRALPAALFAILLVLFAAGLWGTIMRPPAYEIRGEVVARPSPGMLLVRHDAVGALGMSAMDTMAIIADPALVDASGSRAGDRVRLAVRPRGDELILLRIERLR